MLTINDKDLHAEIREALDQEPKVMPGEIGIAVEFGVATPTRGNAYGKHRARTASMRITEIGLLG